VLLFNTAVNKRLYLCNAFPNQLSVFVNALSWSGISFNMQVSHDKKYGRQVPDNFPTELEK